MLDPNAANTSAAGEPEWFCDQCGARFYGPGVCSNAHPANELRKVADAKAEEASGEPVVKEIPAPEAAASVEAEPVEATAPEAAPVEAAPVEVAAPAEPAAPVEPAVADSPVEQAKTLLQKAIDLLHSIST